MKNSLWGTQVKLPFHKESPSCLVSGSAIMPELELSFQNEDPTENHMEDEMESWLSGFLEI